MSGSRVLLILTVAMFSLLVGTRTDSSPKVKSSDTDPPAVRSLGELLPEYFQQTDSDNDGLADSREFSMGTDANLKDTDGDGWPDGAEVASGSDPLAPDDLPFNTTWGVPRIQVVVPGAGATPEDLIFRNGFEPTFGVFTATDISIQITRPAQEKSDAASPNVTIAGPPFIQITRPGQEELPGPANVTIANPVDIEIDWEKKPE